MKSMLQGYSFLFCLTMTFSIVVAEDVDSSGFPQSSADHELLQAEVGVWDCEVSMWMGPEGTPPVVSKATDTIRAIGPFWIRSKFESEFAGLQFVGQGTTGYDPLKKHFVGTWVDSMSPHMWLMHGDYDPATKSLTMKSTGFDLQQQKVITAKYVTTYHDKNQMTFTMFKPIPESGDELKKVMVIKYTRQ